VEGGQVGFGGVAEVADAGQAGLNPAGRGAGGPAHGASDDEFVVVAAELGPGVEEGIEVLAGFDGAEVQQKGLGQVEPGTEGVSVGGGCGEEAGIDAGVDGDDFVGREAEQADGILAGVLADGDETVGAKRRSARRSAGRRRRWRGVELGHEPAGHVVEGGGEGHAGDRTVHLVGGVEDVGAVVEEAIEPAGAGWSRGAGRCGVGFARS
jgi:hypothetical protein